MNPDVDAATVAQGEEPDTTPPTMADVLSFWACEAGEEVTTAAAFVVEAVMDETEVVVGDKAFLTLSISWMTLGKSRSNSDTEGTKLVSKWSVVAASETAVTGAASF